MVTQELTTRSSEAVDAAIVEQVVIQGDLAKLSAGDRVKYYNAVCRSINVNPLTKPFEYITLNSRLTLYARRDCTDQLRRLHRVNLTIVGRERQEDVYVVTARAVMPDGRTDESIGAVSIGALKGDALANALMKAETKAKRRATLSIVGLGWLDETEIETIPDVQAVESAPATKPPERADKALLDRWSALYQEAKAAGLTDLPTIEVGTATREDVIAAGKALRARIDGAKVTAPPAF